MRIIDQFCDAYSKWDERARVGDVYLTAIMQFLGGHVRRGNDPDELGEYEVDDLRQELGYLTGEVHMDAGFLVSSLVRSVETELVDASQAYEEKLPELRRKKEAVESIFNAYQGPVPEHAMEGMRSLLASAWQLHEHAEGAPRPDQQRIADWRELMAPVVDRENLERAYEEQWGEPD